MFILWQKKNNCVFEDAIAVIKAICQNDNVKKTKKTLQSWNSRIAVYKTTVAFSRILQHHVWVQLVQFLPSGRQFSTLSLVFRVNTQGGI